jgi:hypothetical protein
LKNGEAEIIELNTNNSVTNDCIEKLSHHQGIKKKYLFSNEKEEKEIIKMSSNNISFL